VTIALATSSGDVERNSLAPLGDSVLIAAEMSFNTLCRQEMVSL
jgi:hypothetical protein